MTTSFYDEDVQSGVGSHFTYCQMYILFIQILAISLLLRVFFHVFRLSFCVYVTILFLHSHFLTLSTILLSNCNFHYAYLLLIRCKHMLVLFGYIFIIIISLLCRSAAAFLRARNPSPLVSNSEFGEDAQLTKPASLMDMKDSAHQKQQQRLNFQFPFGDWSSHPWLKPHENQQNSRFWRDFSARFSWILSILLLQWTHPPLHAGNTEKRGCNYHHSSPRLQWSESQPENRAKCRKPT